MIDISRYDNAHDDELPTNPKGELHMQYTIQVDWDDMRHEFVAVFDWYDGAPDGHNTYGLGDTKAEAMLNLIENISDEELEP